MSTTPESQAAELPHRVSIELLGASILVRCVYPACAAGIAEYFSAAVVEKPWRTPDVVIDVEWEEADRYLFRARPEDRPTQPLLGVRVHARGAPARGAWSSQHPPLPPLEVEPFANRFVALHAGAVVAPGGGGLAVVGEKRSGKTTTSVDLVNNHGCALLTDEVLFLHRRSRIVEPFPRSVGIADGYDRASERLLKKPQRAERACRRIAAVPALLERIAFLQPDPAATGIEIDLLSPLESLRLLLANQLFASSGEGEAVATLAALARSVPATRVRYATYRDLLGVGRQLLERWEEGHESEPRRDARGAPVSPAQ